MSTLTLDPIISMETSKQRQARVNVQNNIKYHVFGEWFRFDCYPFCRCKVESIVTCVMLIARDCFFSSVDRTNECIRAVKTHTFSVIYRMKCQIKNISSQQSLIKYINWAMIIILLFFFTSKIGMATRGWRRLSCRAQITSREFSNLLRILK